MGSDPLLLPDATDRTEAVFTTGAVGSKRLDQSALPLGHEDGFAVGAAKRQVGWLLGAELDFALQYARRRKYRDGALEDSRHAHGQTMRGFTAAEMERLLAKVD